MNTLFKSLLSIGLVILFSAACENEPISTRHGSADQVTQEGVNHIKDESTGISTMAINKQLGVNYNAGTWPNNIDFVELEKSGTAWVRGIISFFPLYKKYKAGKNWKNDPKVRGYMTLQDQGYKTALSIRYHFKMEGLMIPAKGSPRFIDYMEFTTYLLRHVMPKTTLIIPGNEPFVEALPADKDSQRLVEFYKQTARRTNTYLKNHVQKPLYLGAFDDPYLPYRQNNPAYKKLLRFARNKPWIYGVDIHVHHTYNREIPKAIDFVRTRTRRRQRIIITEYSIKKWWDQHRTDNLPAAFRARYPLPSGVNKVWEYIDYALEHPRLLKEWSDFHRMSPWLRNRRFYICNSFDIFNNYPKFWLAFYALRQQSSGDFAPTDGAWILNPLFANKTVVREPDGDAMKRMWYLVDFKALRAGTPTHCD